jgi:hypothetical protein
MASPKKKTARRTAAKFKDLNSKKNPQGGVDVGGGGLSAAKTSIMDKTTPKF